MKNFVKSTANESTNIQGLSSLSTSGVSLGGVKKRAPTWSQVGTAEIYGMIRADLERMGTPIGANDLLIAAIARAGDCVMVTRNCREFERVVGLRVEVWD